MQHSQDLRDFLENLQNQRFLPPLVAGGFKTRVFRSRGGSICFPSMKSIQQHPRHDPTHPRHAQPSSLPASQLQRRDPSEKSSSRFENPLAEDLQKAAEACHAGKTYEIIRKSRAPAKDSTLRCNFKNPLTDLHEIHIESTGKSRRRAQKNPARKNL